MKIANIYEMYKIPPVLQIHMYRVAVVASLICDNWNEEIDKNSVVQASLLHDMGNIVKFNMSFMPEAFEPEGVEYWTKVKEEFIEKYGADEHEVTKKIIEEINVEKQVKEIITSLGFARAKEGFETKSFEVKVCLYSDQRVMPTGIAFLEKRIDEGYKRFLARKNWPKEELDRFPILSNYLREIEAQIFEKCRIKPENITDKAVAPIIEELRNFEIITT